MKMTSKKSQIGITELMSTVVIAGLLAVIGVMIFSQVSSNIDSSFDSDTNTEINESITITVDAIDDTNSTLLAKKGYITDSEIVKNGTAPFVSLTRDIEYKIALVGGASGGLETQANFTLLNCTDGAGNDSTFNASALFVTYNYNTESDAQATKDNIEDTVLDSFELAIIAIIVLAAVVILSSLFMLGKR